MTFWDRLDTALGGLGVENGAIAWDLAHSSMSDDDLAGFIDLVTKDRDA